jgi:hypothetical protein
MTIQKQSIFGRYFLAFFLTCEALVLFGCFLTPYFTARHGPDQSSYLLEAQRLLSGVEPYGPHLTEVSPPLIIWLSTLPVLLSRSLHGSPMFLLRLLVTAMIFGSVAWCVRILRRGTTLTNPSSIGVLACAILAIEYCIGPYNFAQREHLIIILLLPYALAVATRTVYRLSFAERCVLGVAAGIAIWFKPQYILILVGLELFLALRARGLRRVLTPEFLALILTSSLVLAFVFVAAPLYLRVTLPLLFDTYWAFGKVNTLPLILSSHFYILQVVLMLLACFFFRRSLRDPATTVTLLLCSIAAFYAFAIQHNNWWYHAYPSQAFLLLAMAYLLTDFLYPITSKFSYDSHLPRRIGVIASFVMAVLLCVIAIHPRSVLDVGTHSGSDPLDEYLAQYQPSTTVYVFSTSEASLSFAYNRGLNWGSRFAHLWMLPAIVQNELGPTGAPAPFKKLSPETLSRLVAVQRTESAEDLNYWRPSVVLIQQCRVDNSCQGMEGKDFDMLSWFLQSPEFAAAWSHYQRQSDFDNFSVYKFVP